MMWNILIIILCIMSIDLLSQNITTTLGTGGSFIVKDGANTFLSLDQATGKLTLNSGVIFKGADRLLNTFGTDNIFLGRNSGNFTMTGIDNTSIGVGTLLSNTTGAENTAVGISALNLNTTGSYNTAVGTVSLKNNITGYANTGCGIGSLYSNTEGNHNSAYGNVALYNNTSGSKNSAFGEYSLYSNTEGWYNTAIGNDVLHSNSTGSSNTSVGFYSLYYNTTGQLNTAIGYSTGSNILGDNNIAIGSYAQVPNNSGNNQVRIGDVSITYAGIQVAWTITSDKRWKENIQPTDLGLGFISKLNPVSYARKNDEKQKVEYGLIAQELEEVLKEEGVTNAAMLTIDGEGRYELRYNDLFAPIIKAIQELKTENEQLKAQLEDVKEMRVQLTEVKILKEELTKQIELLKTSNENASVKFSSLEK